MLNKVVDIQKKKNSLEKDEKGFLKMNKTNLRILCQIEELYEQPELNNHLYLNNKGFLKIENLEEYKNICAVYLNNNCFTKIENLSSLVKLVTLYLQENIIEKIENLSELQNIRILNLAHNKISVVENLQCLYKLETLNLSQNRLQNYDGILGLLDCQSLTNIDISHNEIEYDERILDLFKNLENLLCLQNQLNPFVREFKQYRKVWINALPKLNYLDERPVFIEERRLVMAWGRGGRDEEKKERQLMADEKREYNKKYVKDAKKRKEHAKMQRQMQLDTQKKEIAIEKQKIQIELEMAQKENLDQNMIDGLKNQIKECDLKIQECNNFYDKIVFDRDQLLSCYSITRLDNGDIIVHDRSPEDAEYIKKKILEVENKEQQGTSSNKTNSTIQQQILESKQKTTNNYNSVEEVTQKDQQQQIQQKIILNNDVIIEDEDEYNPDEIQNLKNYQQSSEENCDSKEEEEENSNSDNCDVLKNITNIEQQSQPTQDTDKDLRKQQNNNEIQVLENSEWSQEYDQLLELLLETHNFNFYDVTQEINNIFKEIAGNMNKKNCMKFNENQIREQWTKIEINKLEGKNIQSQSETSVVTQNNTTDVNELDELD